MKKTLLIASVIASFSTPVFADGYIYSALGYPIQASVYNIDATKAVEAEKARQLAEKARQLAEKALIRAAHEKAIANAERKSGTLFKRRF